MISTEEEYQQALQWLVEHNDYDFGTPECEKYWNLSDKVGEYERFHYPILKPFIINWIWYKIVKQIGIVLR